MWNDVLKGLVEQLDMTSSQHTLFYLTDDSLTGIFQRRGGSWI